MRKIILISVLSLMASRSYASGEDSYTLSQILVNAIKTLETLEKVNKYQKEATVALAGDIWKDIGGTTNWKSDDESMGVNLVGNMTNITFSDGNDRSTLGINVDDAIQAIRGKGELNFTYANRVIKLQTESIRRDGKTMNKLLDASKRSANQLQALQILLRATLESINQTRGVRTQLAADSQYQLNKDKEAEEKEKIRVKKEAELMQWKY